MNSYIVQINLRPKFGEQAADAYFARVRRELINLDGIVDGVTVHLLINAGTLRTHSVGLIADLLPPRDYVIIADSTFTAREWSRLTRERVPA